MSFFEIPAFRNIILRNLKSFGESMEILFEKILWNYDDFFKKKNNNANNEKSAN